MPLNSTSPTTEEKTNVAGKQRKSQTQRRRPQERQERRKPGLASPAGEPAEGARRRQRRRFQAQVEEDGPTGNQALQALRRQRHPWQPCQARATWPGRCALQPLRAGGVEGPASGSEGRRRRQGPGAYRPGPPADHELEARAGSEAATDRTGRLLGDRQAVELQEAQLYGDGLLRHGRGLSPGLWLQASSDGQASRGERHGIPLVNFSPPRSFLNNSPPRRPSLCSCLGLFLQK